MHPYYFVWANFFSEAARDCKQGILSFIIQTSGRRTNSGLVVEVYSVSREFRYYLLFLGKPTAVRHSALLIYSNSPQPFLIKDCDRGLRLTNSTPWAETKGRQAQVKWNNCRPICNAASSSPT